MRRELDRDATDAARSLPIVARVRRWRASRQTSELLAPPDAGRPPQTAALGASSVLPAGDAGPAVRGELDPADTARGTGRDRAEGRSMPRLSTRRRPVQARRRPGDRPPSGAGASGSPRLRRAHQAPEPQHRRAAAYSRCPRPSLERPGRSPRRRCLGAAGTRHSPNPERLLVDLGGGRRPTGSSCLGKQRFGVVREHQWRRARPAPHRRRGLDVLERPDRAAAAMIAAAGALRLGGPATLGSRGRRHRPQGLHESRRRCRVDEARARAQDRRPSCAPLRQLEQRRFTEVGLHAWLAPCHEPVAGLVLVEDAVEAGDRTAMPTHPGPPRRSTSSTAPYPAAHPRRASPMPAGRRRTPRCRRPASAPGFDQVTISRTLLKPSFAMSRKSALQIGRPAPGPGSPGEYSPSWLTFDPAQQHLGAATGTIAAFAPCVRATATAGGGATGRPRPSLDAPAMRAGSRRTRSTAGEAAVSPTCSIGRVSRLSLARTHRDSSDGSAEGGQQLGRAGEHDVERGPAGGGLVLDLLRGGPPRCRRTRGPWCPGR